MLLEVIGEGGGVLLPGSGKHEISDNNVIIFVSLSRSVVFLTHLSTPLFTLWSFLIGNATDFFLDCLLTDTAESMTEFWNWRNNMKRLVLSTVAHKCTPNSKRHSQF